ncbi:hypothetical protein Tco_0953427 [Tanacetum coccineum]|uniref:Reverse transcriptase domain-containing protein n=1 Tax=Tanacetum coccineum TaxID=301880 RepID=A0ABQ5DZV3_9ASTR
MVKSSLIPLSRGSFDVIVGMDWLSKRKFVIVCHEKVVRIPLEGDEILQVTYLCFIKNFSKIVKSWTNKWKKGQMMVSTLWIKLYSEYEYEIRYDPGKANVVTNALSRKEGVKPRRVREMAMTIQYGVPLVGSEMDEAHASRYLVKAAMPKTFGLLQQPEILE